MSLIIHHSRFKGESVGGGGQKRTAQIKEDLSGEYNRIIILEDDFKRMPNLWSLIWSFLWSIKKHIYLTFSPRKLIRIARIYEQYNPVFKQYSAESDIVFMWESVVDEYFCLFELAKKYNFKIYAYPHNLESLVYSQKSFLSKRKSPNWFDEELSCLKKCDKVFVISREEEWLLRLYNVNSIYYPFNLTQDSRKEVLNVRNRRATESKGSSTFLILGSAVNPPTYIGIQSLLNCLKGGVFSKYEFVVVGSRTESFKHEVENHSYITCKGFVSEGEFIDLCSKVSAVLVHQIPTTGALTRIRTFMEFGVPVISNVNGARSYFGQEGITVYENFSQLKKIIQDRKYEKGYTYN